MRAAQRNAKIARAKGLGLKRNWGGGKLREVFGDAPVMLPLPIIPKHVLRRQRQAEQRTKEKPAL